MVALWGQYDSASAYTEDEYLSEQPSCTVAYQDEKVIGSCIGHHASTAWME